MSRDIRAEKKKFIEQEFMDATIRAGLTRGTPVYKPNISKPQKDIFRDAIKEKLRKYATSYMERGVKHEEHISNIRRFAEEISKAHSDILHKDTLVFGRAQKLLNLYLKYRWANGIMNKEPPHCPIDGKIVSEVRGKYIWTASDSEEEYRTIMELIKREAEARGWSIAVWELCVWQKADSEADA